MNGASIEAEVWWLLRRIRPRINGNATQAGLRGVYGLESLGGGAAAARGQARGRDGPPG